MDYFRRLEPTPSALHNGRRVMVVFAAILVVLLALMVADGTFRDPGTNAIIAATLVTIVGDAIAYLGHPTLARYRLGLVIATVGIVAGFGFLLLDTFGTK